MVRDFSLQIFCNVACSSSCALVVVSSLEIYSIMYSTHLRTYDQ